MKRMINKLSAMTVAMMLIFGMGTGVYADSTGAGSLGQGNSISFTDTFTISEGDNAQNLPAAAFNYSIGTSGVSAVAASASTPKINVGIGQPDSDGGAHAATAAGTTADSVDVTVDFNGVNFSEAGIYRYSIKEEMGASNVAEDIAIDVDNGSQGTYFLDVYVQREGSGFGPYAYILSKSGSINSYDKSGDPQKVNYSDKVDEITNEYTTYDLTVSKTIVGAMAANQFDFDIDVANVPEDAFIAKDGEIVAGSEGGNHFSATLGDDQSTEILGLPSAAVYAIKETVNQEEGYAVEVTTNEAQDDSYGWLNSAEFGKADATAMGKSDAKVGFTNTLRTISPTGVVMRFAPYMMILGAGLALVLISRRRKAIQE